jgi:hypothetical protein
VKTTFTVTYTHNEPFRLTAGELEDYLPPVEGSSATVTRVGTVVDTEEYDWHEDETRDDG